MRYHLPILLLIFFAGQSAAMGILQTQRDTVPKAKRSLPKNAAAGPDEKKTKPGWFEQNVTIGQSMATTDQQQLPAQFTVTLPKDKGGSFLVDFGAGVKLKFLSTKQSIVSKFIAEYHRNTLTDSVQNNYQFGIKSTFDLDAKKEYQVLHKVIIIDPQYIVDRVNMQNSIASNFLLTWNSDGGPVNWNNNNYVFDRRGSIVPSILIGTQVQQVFAGDTTAPNGFKLRPLAIGNLSYLFFKKNNQFDPVVRLLVAYSQRIAAVNDTHDGEKWTHLFRAAADYYIMLKPVKLSVGVSFINGSDMFAGLKQQQYFLLSLNLFAGSGK